MPPRALAVFAHPDDLEFLAAGTMLLWARRGWETGLVLLTSGDRGSDDPRADPVALARTREAEAEEAADLLGIGRVVLLRREDGSLVHDLALRRDIAREVRRFRPDVLVTQDPTTVFVGRHYVNHPDHRAAGEATLAAVYPAAKKPLVFPELLAEGLAPHLVPHVWLAATTEPDTWIDVAPVLEAKVEALLRHRSQFTGGSSPAGAVRSWAREAAAGTPLVAAEPFRTLELRRRSYDDAEDPSPLPG